MRLSTERILTTHTGSLPRPQGMLDLLLRQQRGELDDEAELRRSVRGAVEEAVRRQVDCGLDVINDGEMGRVDYTVFVKDLLTGFEGESMAPIGAAGDAEFPELGELLRPFASPFQVRPACVGPVEWKDWPSFQRDLENLAAAVRVGSHHRQDGRVSAQEGRDGTQALRQAQGERDGPAFPVQYPVLDGEVFMTSPSPGQIARFLHNDYYDDEEEYLYALGDVMRRAYEAIVDAGFLLQLDCPDLALSRSTVFSHLSLGEFRDVIRVHVEALNHAVSAIPPERMRMHVCWSSTMGPHHTDVPLRDIVDIILQARPMAFSFPAANPRHGHEWKIWQDIDLPEGKVVIPGMIDSTSNFVEHPEYVAERIVRYAGVVGRENMLVGADCGFGTFAGRLQVDSKIVWMKLASLVEGARLASEELWPRPSTSSG